MKTACYFIATPWTALDVVNLAMSNESFWKPVQYMSQIPCKREDMAEDARFVGPTFSAFSCRAHPGPRTEVTGREASTSSKEDLSNRVAQQLNGLLGEVESLEVFKVKRSPL